LAGRQVNLGLNEVLMNLLELRMKRMLVCVKYIGALDRDLVPTLVVSDLKGVDISCDSIGREEGFGLHLATR
jgi:hypothetical protein